MKYLNVYSPEIENGLWSRILDCFVYSPLFSVARIHVVPRGVEASFQIGFCSPSLVSVLNLGSSQPNIQQHALYTYIANFILWK